MKATLQIAVLKFGGTSVASPEARAAAQAHVRAALAAGFGVVAVVSAPGRKPAPYATDTLLELLGGETGTRNADLAIACGELLGAAIFARELCASGIEALALSGAQAGICTDEQFGDARILHVDPTQVRGVLARGAVAVVAGFQGVGESGATTTLGRGGSDLTAIALGAALDAQRVDLFTDVAGAMTADPRRIDAARTIERATHDEMCELSELGARVMHEKAAKHAQAAGIRYAIRDLYSGKGTLVDETHIDRSAPVSGVTTIAPMTWIRVDRQNGEPRDTLELELLRRLAAAGISIDQVSINATGFCFAVRGDCADLVRPLLGDLALSIAMRERCAKLSVVGAGMRGVPGIVHRVVAALHGAQVEIVHCTDSHITISVLVPAAQSERAERALHDAFHLATGA